MRIAIASGKGGTGKTTVATNLAWVAARNGHSVAYLDCDVEEPNGHLFLKPEIASSRPIGRLHPAWMKRSARTAACAARSANSAPSSV